MDHAPNLVPVTVRIVAAIVGVLAVGYGVFGYFLPSQLVPGFQGSVDANHTLALMFAARNVAIGLVMVLLAWRGVPESIAAIFIVRFLVELQDAIIMGTTSATFIAALAKVWTPAIFLIVEVAVIVTLFRVIGKRDAAMAAAKS